MIKIKRGLDLPISGTPRQEIDNAAAVSHVALLGGEFHGLKPTMAVQEGDRVSKGQLLFTDKKTAGVKYTSPASGVVKGINRGKQRALLSVEIAVEGDAAETFNAYSAEQLAGLSREQVVEQLVESGAWTALRTRPFGKVPATDTAPHALFVTAMDSNPLTANPDVIISEQLDAFRAGLLVLSKLTEGITWVCRAATSKLPSFAAGSIREESFSGPHPAGNASTHIHFIDPVGLGKVAWHIGYQDVIAVGRLFLDGQLYNERVVALAGPQVSNPRLVRTLQGASLAELTAGELKEGSSRVISGSVFGGHHARGAVSFLGRWANQVTVIAEAGDRALLGYLSPGFERHSVLNIYLSKLFPGKKLDMTSTTNGSERAMVSLGNYEEVMPLDILATPLLRAIAVGDMDSAIDLGALELIEEDVALCTYTCVGKYEYGPILRDNLTRIEQEV